MKKLILIISALFFTNLAFAQKYMSKTGKVTFEASVPLFEDVFAQDDNNVAVINADTGEFASVSVVKNFPFQNKINGRAFQ
jgi:hypothetical protein